MSKPFDIAWKNPDEPIKSDGRDKVKCGVCEKEGLPFGDWGYSELVIRPGEISGYEYQFWTCSKECERKSKPFKDKKIKELT